MSIKNNIYKLLRISNDINAVRKNKIGKRIKNRVLGKFFRKFFK